ncbi:MAG: tyrosine-type recombinase/integrase [Acidobacteriota bacterium]
MPLTDVAVRNAKPGPKTIRLRDDRGLYLEISPRGGKWWRFRSMLKGKANMIFLGVYHDVSLKDARERRDEARKLIANGIDPSQARKDENAEVAADAVSFEKVAREWFSKFKENWTAGHADRTMRRFEMDVFPWIGARPIRDILAPDLLTTIRRIEARGAIETAHRTLQNCGQVFRYAVTSGHADRDISGDLRGAIPPSKEKHHASVTDPKDVASLLRAIETYQGSFVTSSALLLAPMLFVRPGELRHAEWSEIDLDKGEWRIPAAGLPASP